MSTAIASASHGPDDSHAHGGHFEKMAQFGMLVFLCSETMLFTGLIGTYAILRIIQGNPWIPEGRPELPWGLTSINTFFLISSSFTFHFAEEALKKGKSPIGWLVPTILLGSIFVGLQGKEWTSLYHEGLWITAGLHYSSCFFVLTGFHGFHVFVGVLLLTVTLIRTKMGHFTADKHAFFANVGLYWHFVDVVWVVLYSIVYFNFAWQALDWLTHMIMH